MSALKTYRQQEALTQKELAEISGVGKRIIQDYEQGQRNINGASGERLYKLSLALGCKMEDLLENKEEIRMVILQNLYNEWRKQAEEHNKWEDEHGGSIPVYWGTDSGEESVRADFSNWANLEEQISFEDMLVLENAYNK